MNLAVEMSGRRLRPVSLKIGAKVYYVDCEGNQKGERLIPVWVVKYDACPAYMIVRDEKGMRWRCLRELLRNLYADMIY